MSEPLKAYYVNPTNTSDIRRHDLDGKALCTGGDDRQPYNLPAGNPTYNPTVREDVYIAIQATYSSRRNFYTTPTTVFEGSVKDPAARVRETAVFRPIDEIHAMRVEDLAQKFSEVIHQGMTVNLTGTPSAALNTTAEAVTQYQGMLGAIRTTDNTAGLPAITAVKVVDLWGNFVGGQMGDVYEIHSVLFIHHTQSITQKEVHSDELERLRVAGDPAALADYDINTGWPPAPVRPART